MSFLSKITSIFSLFKQSIRGDEQNFTEGSINRALFLLSVPMVLEMSMEALFALADVLFVSMMGDNDAIATIGLTESIVTIVYSLAFGLSMGVTALVSRRTGEKDIKAGEVVAMQAIYIGLGLSILISIVGIIFSTDILRLMGASEALIAKGSGYPRLMLGGNITIIMLFLCNAIFRGAGNASIAMRSLIIANGLNILLDPLFIFGWGPVPAFGVTGAAIATNIGRGCGVLYQLYYLIRGKSLIKLRRVNFPIKWDLIKQIVKLSAGGAGQFIIASASWIFLYSIMTHFGNAVVAGYTIAIRIMIFTILPAWGMANASATLVGQNLGAGHPERAEKSAWRAAFLNMIFLGFISIFFWLVSKPVLNFFTDDPEVLTNGVLCLKVVSLGYMFYAYGMVISQSFNGAGDTITPTILNFFTFWMIQIPGAYAMAILLDLGPVGVYAAIPGAESLMAVACIIIFRRGKWKQVKV